MTAPAWVIVCSRAPEVTERDFRRVGYRVYLPRYRKAIWPHGVERKPASILSPLWSGILFAQDWRGWPEGQRIGGEPRLMRGMSGKHARLSEGDVVKIMDKERALEFDEVKYPAGGGMVIVRDDIPIGADVQIELRGARIRGVLHDLTDAGKAVIEYIMLGGPVRSTVDAGALSLVEA